MCLTLLQDSRLYEYLLKIDQELARQIQADGCPCGGRLDRADYPRKPRGGPPDLGREYERRLSFCCAREGCRRRRTPPSVRFFGPKVYLGAVVLLVSAMKEGLTDKRVVRLRELFGVSRRTLRRWRRWWLQEFPASRLWARKRGDFMPPVDKQDLPASFLERFLGDEARSRVIQALRFLAPLTTRSCENGLAD